MRKPYIALAVLVTAALAVAGWQVLRPQECEPEPVYQGKPLTSWLNYRTALKPVPQKIQEQEADEVVRQAGTNALPTLLRRLGAKDSRWKTQLMYWAQRQPIITIDYTRADEWNWAARRGFEVLGAKAQCAVPALIEIANRNISPESQYWAIDALGFIGPSAHEAVPSLLRWATNEYSIASSAAISALGKIDPEAAAKAGVK